MALALRMASMHRSGRYLFFLSSQVPDAAQDGLSILVDGGPHLRSGSLSVTALLEFV